MCLLVFCFCCFGHTQLQRGNVHTTGFTDRGVASHALPLAPGLQGFAAPAVWHKDVPAQKDRNSREATPSTVEARLPQTRIPCFHLFACPWPIQRDAADGPLRCH